MSVRGLKHKVAKSIRRTFISRPNRDAWHSLSESPVVVAGLFSTGSGIGQSARACYRALEQAGVDCVALDLSSKFNQVDLISDIPTIETLPRNREGTIILHLNGPETQHGLYHAGLLRGRNWRVIGYWAWELQEPPQGWSSAASFLSEIWTPSEFVKSSIEAIVDVPVRVVPHYVPVPEKSAHEKSGPQSASNTLTFLTMADGFSSFHRKNLLGAIEAYTEAFEEEDGHRLVVKCRNLHRYNEFCDGIHDAVGERKDITIITRTLHEDDMWSLMQDADVVLSLHRAEGFGLHLAEAMALGKVAIGTNWSGNLSFMTPENSILIPSELVDLEDPTGIYRAFEGSKWAQASISYARDKLREIARDRPLREKLGSRARSDIGELLSFDLYKSALRVQQSVTTEQTYTAFAE